MVGKIIENGNFVEIFEDFDSEKQWNEEEKSETG
jgi:hypothetical protein